MRGTVAFSQTWFKEEVSLCFALWGLNNENYRMNHLVCFKALILEAEEGRSIFYNESHGIISSVLNVGYSPLRHS